MYMFAFACAQTLHIFFCFENIFNISIHVCTYNHWLFVLVLFVLATPYNVFVKFILYNRDNAMAYASILW